MEKADSPYVNILVVQQGREAEPWVKTMVEAYQSPEVKAFIDEKYDGAVITSCDRLGPSFGAALFRQTLDRARRGETAPVPSPSAWPGLRTFRSV